MTPSLLPIYSIYTWTWTRIWLGPVRVREATGGGACNASALTISPERRTRRVAAPSGQPPSPHRLGGPSGLPPVRGASAAVRAGDRAAGPVVRSGRGLGRAGAGSEPPSMDFSQLGCILLSIWYCPLISLSFSDSHTSKS
uniref:Uncharacterized protein n=1 Tax=Triticum urartu TaxID=4572 RepID=A0A8R7R5L6_TRIUA